MVTGQKTVKDNSKNRTPSHEIFAVSMVKLTWYWLLLIVPINGTINLDAYCEQMDKLHTAIHQERPFLANQNVIHFHYCNVRLNTSLQTRQKLLRFGWGVLLHFLYFPDLAPSNYHPFQYIQNTYIVSYSIFKMLKLTWIDFFFVPKD